MWGGKDSLRAAIWEVLKQEPEGLLPEEIAQRVARGDFKLASSSNTSEAINDCPFPHSQVWIAAPMSCFAQQSQAQMLPPRSRGTASMVPKCYHNSLGKRRTVHNKHDCM